MIAPEVKFEWVPSHGKMKRNWHTDSPIGAVGVRQLNDYADKKATRAVGIQLNRYNFKQADETEAESIVQMQVAMQRIAFGQLDACEKVPSFMVADTTQVKQFC